MYHAVGTDPKSNMKIVERDARWIHEKHKSQLGDPTAASSPKRMNRHKPRDRLRLLEINFQSITNKSADLQMAIDSSQPDIIIGDWYCDLTVVMSFTSCSMYSPLVRLGGL
jgi:hypothetical protein